MRSRLSKQVAGIIAPDEAVQVKLARGIINAALGIDLRNDLLGALDDKVVLYSTPSEGPLSLGQVVMVKVKDEAKLRKAIEGLVKGLSKTAGSRGDIEEAHLSRCRSA